MKLIEMTPLLNQFQFLEEKINVLVKIAKLAGTKKVECASSLGIKDLEKTEKLQMDGYGSLILPGKQGTMFEQGYKEPVYYDLMAAFSFDSATMLRICDLLIKEYRAEQEKITKQVEKLNKTH